MSDGVGKVAYAQNIAQYFVLAASLGIPNYGIREIARRRKDEEQTKELFSSLFFINLISTLICTALYYALILNLPYFSSRKMISLAAGLLIIFNAFNVDWFYQGQEAFKYIAIRSFVVKVISLAAIFVFIRSSEDYVRYMLVIVLTTGGKLYYQYAAVKKVWYPSDMPWHKDPAAYETDLYHARNDSRDRTLYDVRHHDAWTFV